MYKENLKQGVSLTVIPSDKFKSNLLQVEIACPLLSKTATHNALLAKVLSRCCEAYPTLKLFNTALEELYAAELDAYVLKTGETQRLCFRLSCIENSYAYDGTDVLRGALSLMREMIFRPLLVECVYDKVGIFDEAVVESEKRNLREEIEALKEDKARYAAAACIKEMCKSETYSVPVQGSIGDLNRPHIAAKPLKKKGA